MNDPDLRRFVDAQSGIYDCVVQELSTGRKSSHWMWFIFPQMAGLGFSEMAQRYAIRSRAEAQAYLSHALLGRRLKDCTRLVLSIANSSIQDILGSPDDMKFRSSMTLFHAVSGETLFADAINRFCPEGNDLRTLRILASDQ